MATWQAAAEAASAARPGRWRSRGWSMDGVARLNGIGHALGGPVQILTPGKVAEIFHMRLDGP